MVLVYGPFMERVLSCIFLHHDLRVVAIAYDVGRTQISIIAAILLSGAGWWLSLSERRFATFAAAAVLGAGISTMHFVGMSAMIMPGRLAYSADLVIASLV